LKKDRINNKMKSKTTKKQLVKALFAGMTLGVGIFGSYQGWKYYQRQGWTIPKVGGEAEISNKPFISYDFQPCAAIVFDYRQKTNLVGMVHAIPIGLNENGKYSILTDRDIEVDGKIMISIGHSVNHLIKKSLERGLNPFEAEVSYSAGDPISAKFLEEEFKKRGMKVVHSDIRNKTREEAKTAPKRAITFKNHKLEVHPQSEVKDYRMFWEGR